MIRSILIFALSAIAAAIARGASIESLVSEALRRNPELEYYRAGIAIAHGERRTAREYPNPELNTELGGKFLYDGASGAGPLWTLGFEQPIDFRSRRALRTAIAGGQIALAELALQDFQLELANRVRLLAYHTVVARKRVEISQGVSDRFGDLARVLNEREPTGVGPMLEARIIEANTLTMDRSRIEAERQLQTASYELNQLRAAPADSVVEIDEEAVSLTPLPSTAWLIASARVGNLDVRMRAAELEQQGFKVRLARADKWPGVTVGGFVHGESADSSEVLTGLSVRLPLPLWNQNKGAIETAKAREAQAAASLNATLRKIENEIAAAVASYNARLKEIARWSPEVLGKMREAADEADKSYRLGAIPMATYTELQKEYLEAQTALLATQADALEARQKVELLIGRRIGPMPSASKPGNSPKRTR